jgi:hypothetical protein
MVSGPVSNGITILFLLFAVSVFRYVTSVWVIASVRVRVRVKIRVRDYK